MKVLTATRTGQGSRENDFDWTVEGELVLIGLVRDLPMSRDDVVTAVLGYWEAAGYAAHYTVAEGERLVDDLLETVSAWPAGTIVERRLDVVRPRQIRR